MMDEPARDRSFGASLVPSIIINPPRDAKVSTLVVLLKRPPPMSLAPAATASSVRSVRPSDLHLFVHAPRRCDRNREFSTHGISGQHLHRR
jgi:hypothetical protein